MNVELIENSIPVVRVSGEVDYSNADQLHRVIKKAAEQQTKGFILDLTDTTYLDSAGIQVILSAFQLVRSNHGKLPIVAKHPTVMDNLMTVHLDMLPGIVIVKDLASAEKVIVDLK